MSDTALLVDGTGCLFRSFYAVGPVAAPDGTPVNAVLGLGMTLHRLLRDVGPAYAVVAFDAGPTTFRNELYPQYKANRGEPPDELVPQFDLSVALTRALGLATARMAGYEADDLLATLTRRLLRAGKEVIVASADKDLAQLVRPGVTLLDPASGERWGVAEIPRRLGVRAEQVRDLLAIMGDASDNIPGVRGIGKVGALALLAAFTDLDAIYADLDAVERLPVRGAAALRRRLAESRGLAYLSRQLATVDHDAPCSLRLSQMRFHGAEGDALDAFAQQWGLQGLARRAARRGSHPTGDDAARGRSA
jgi:DNA polymerase-1